MTSTTVTVDVDRPADEVFAYAIDPTHFHEWQNGVVTGRMERPGMPEVGDHCLTTRIGGAERPSTSEVAARRATPRVERPRHRRPAPGQRGPRRRTHHRDAVTSDHQRGLRRPWHRKVPGAAHGPTAGGQGDAHQHASAQGAPGTSRIVLTIGKYPPAPTAAKAPPGLLDCRRSLKPTIDAQPRPLEAWKVPQVARRAARSRASVSSVRTRSAVRAQGQRTETHACWPYAGWGRTVSRAA